jgi:hypothetical protein
MPVSALDQGAVQFILLVATIVVVGFILSKINAK